MNLDLTKILQGCEGIKIYCVANGVAKIEQIANEGIAKAIVIRTETGWLTILDEFGRADKNGECLIWPSKTNRDWSTFKKPYPLPAKDELCWTMSSVGNWVPRYATGEKDNNGNPIFFDMQNKDKKHTISINNWRPWCNFEELFKK